MAAPTLQQIKVYSSSAAVTSGAATFNTAPASGAFIVVFVYSSVNYSGLSISDAGGNTYTNRQSNGYGDMWGRLYTAPASSNPGAITVTQSSGYLKIVAVEVRGYNAASPIEQLGVGYWYAITAASSPFSPFTYGSTAAAEQLFVANVGLNVIGTHDWTAGSGWTAQDVGSVSGELGHALISRQVTSTGTYNPTWTSATAGSRNSVSLGLSIVAGSDGLPSGGPVTKRLAGVPFAALNSGVF